jgi:nucleotide-binding universal stress UspA family protein
MFQSLLVPLDGSPFGEQALPLAQEIARRSGAAVEVAHVHDPVADRLLTYYTLDPRVKESERAYLRSQAGPPAALPGGSATSALLNGPVVDALREHAAAIHADLVVMTTHGRGPLSRFWLGSVADQLVRHLSIPILLVRPRDAPPDPQGEKPVLRRVLVPLDGSALAEQILEPALALVELMGAKCCLFRVVEPVGKPATLNRRQEDARAYLEQVAQPYQARSLPVHTRVAVHSHPAAAILDEAQALRIDLIALATHGRGGLKRLLLGSVADKVLRGASIPVLVRRPVGVAAGQGPRAGHSVR